MFAAPLDEIKATLPALWPGVILSLVDREYRVLFSNPYLSEGSVPKPVDPVGL